MKRTHATLLIGVFLIAAAGIPVLRRDAARADRAPVLRSSTLATPSARPTSLEFRMFAAESTYMRSQHDSARSAWRALLTDPEVAADSAVVAQILTWLATVAWQLSDYQESRLIGEQSLALKLRRGYTGDLARSYNVLGLIAWNEGRLADALALYRDGSASAQQNGDQLMIGKFASNTGLIEVELARFSQARRNFENAHEIATALGDAYLEANALTNLAMLDIRVDAPADAIPRLQRARMLYEQIEHPTGIQVALGQLSTAFAGLGDLQRAFATIDSADVLAERHGLKRERAASLEFRGDLYRDAGDRPKALQQYERAQALNRELGLEIERGTVLRKAAVVHLAMGANAAAFASARAAAEIHRSTGAGLEELRDHVLLARGDATHLEVARRLSNSIGTPSARAEVALAAARIELERGSYKQLLHLLRADSLDIERAGFELEGEAAALRATAYAHTNFPIAAAASVRHAVQALESARATLGSGLLRASFAADRASLYARLIDVELRMGRPREALRIADLARARPLAVMVRGESDPAAMALLRVRELTDNANELLAAIADGDDTLEPALAAVQAELADSRAEYESIVARSAWQPGAGATASFESITAALRPDEAILEYLVADRRVLAFVLTRAGVRAQVLALPARDLVSRIRVARTGLTAVNGDASRSLEALHDALVAPFAAELAGKHRLVVVPHAALTYLPFAALRDGRTGRYLIEDYVIQYLPAASELARLRAAPAITRRPQAVVLQPFPKELPGTRVEARTVARAWRGRVLAGKRATSTAMRTALDSDDVLHVSSHAAMDPRTPLFSYVSLAQHNNDDGRFEVHEVFASRVRNPLVYLSGCETGLGGASTTGYESGADAGTFAHAFLAAGARAVVSTAWRIEDGSAAVFAGAFYRHLRSHDAAEAIARAQRGLLKAPAYRQPFYWAPYMLTGDVEFGR